MTKLIKESVIKSIEKLLFKKENNDLVLKTNNKNKFAPKCNLICHIINNTIKLPNKSKLWSFIGCGLLDLGSNSDQKYSDSVSYEEEYKKA